MGGAVAAIEAGYQMDEIEQAAYEYAKSIDDGERVIVGVNRFVDDEPEPEVFPIDPALQRQQADRREGCPRQPRPRRRRACARRRGGRRARHAEPAASDEGRARRHATLGEVSDALREVFGIYHPSR